MSNLLTFSKQANISSENNALIVRFEEYADTVEKQEAEIEGFQKKLIRCSNDIEVAICTIQKKINTCFGEKEGKIHHFFKSENEQSDALLYKKQQIRDLRLELLQYPRLPRDKKYNVAMIKDLLLKRCEHHEEIKQAVIQLVKNCDVELEEMKSTGVYSCGFA